MSFAVLAVILSCPAKRVTTKLQRQYMFSSFKHKKHDKFFKRENIVCANCHYMQVSLEGKTPQQADAISQEFMYPSMEECHFCHRNEKFKAEAPQNCMICHKDTQQIMPQNHRKDWLKEHKTVSRQTGGECASCHEENYCTDCHLRRDSVRQMVHERNYIFYHSIEARNNPRKCVSCHSAVFCKDCHTERGITQ